MNVLDHVRLATLEDIPVLLGFAKEFHRSSPYRSIAFDYGKTLTGFKQIIEGGGLNSIVLVAHEDQTPVGMVVAVAERPAFSSELITMELAWFITEKHRKSRKGLVLFKAYEDWAKRIGAKIVQTAYLIGPGQSDPDAFYVNQGYTPVEKSYMKKVMR